MNKPGKNKLKSLTRPFVPDFVAMLQNYDDDVRAKIYDRFRIECERTITEAMQKKEIEQTEEREKLNNSLVNACQELERIHKKLKESGADPRLIALYESIYTTVESIKTHKRTEQNGE